MSSELVSLLIKNASSFGIADIVVLLIVALSVSCSVAFVIHWVYKHAFETRGHVIDSQEKLIALKDKTIAEYEQSMKRLAVEKSEADAQVTSGSRQLHELRAQIDAQNRVGHQKEAALLLYAAAQRIGVLTAQNVFYSLEFCRNMRFLVNVHSAVARQHADRSGPPPGTLLEEIDVVEDFLLEQARTLGSLDNVGFDAPKIPTALLTGSGDDERRKRNHDLEDLVVKAALPLLQKHEPEFALRVETSYKSRK